MKENFILFSIAINLGLMVYSILMTNKLFLNGLIDKSRKRTFILFSVVVPIFGFITVLLQKSRSKRFLVK
jgi:hypothetical protein